MLYIIIFNFYYTVNCKIRYKTYHLKYKIYKFIYKHEFIPSLRVENHGFGSTVTIP